MPPKRFYSVSYVPGLALFPTNYKKYFKGGKDLEEIFCFGREMHIFRLPE
jgi:hypothetical protein